MCQPAAAKDRPFEYDYTYAQLEDQWTTLVQDCHDEHVLPGPSRRDLTCTLKRHHALKATTGLPDALLSRVRTRWADDQTQRQHLLAWRPELDDNTRWGVYFVAAATAELWTRAAHWNDADELRALDQWIGQQSPRQKFLVMAAITQAKYVKLNK